MENQAQQENLVRIDTVIKRTGLSQRTIYRRMKEGDFPQNINIGGNVVVWLESEINQWIAEKIKQRNQ
ncbi:DNA-binding protein [Haemophilus paracuniculus]|uniref:DNA-binding protein n=1 Tax=Haemophilus paracuniculus TaxID=734 RepID=A0A1T0AR83_9PAST|nr:AlpA family transcriptional regulator [Haemophilus paracuniculus]OOR98865.1 DNA-binding protein [Haemophilus paracuniculus]